MARTAIVNPRRRRKAAKKRSRRRNYGARRARRANPGSSDRNYNPRRRRRAPSRRRRNPASPASSVYSSGGYRRKNPDFLDFDGLMNEVPAATAGVWLARWATKMAGPFEQSGQTPAPGQTLRPVPGIKHAVALLLAAKYGSQMVGSALGAEKAKIAYYSALGFAGDLFARTRLFDDSKWVQDNLYLNGVEDGAWADGESPDYEGISGFEEQSALGEGELVQGPDGTIYQLQGGELLEIAPDPADFDGGNVSGFEEVSALGFSRGSSSVESSFGYTPGA